MSKMRVYELARDLKMDSKDLVDKLQELGYEVRNHMSVIAREEAEQVRDKLQAMRSEVVVEKRITSKVIRRRRKKVTPAPEAAEEAAAPAEAPEAAPEAVAQEAEAAQATETEPTAAAEAEPAEPAEGPAAPEARTAEPEAAAPMPPSEAAAQQALTEAEQEAAAEPVAEDEPAPGKAKKAAKKGKSAARVVRAPRGGGAPAKIISRPTRPVEPVPARREAPGARPAPGRGRPAQAPGDEAVPPPIKEETSRRRKKGKKSAHIPTDEFLLRKAKSRRREILDKADLYDGRPSRGRRRPSKKAKKTQVTTPRAIKRRIKVGEAITASELARRMGVKGPEMIKHLMQTGMIVTLNQSLDLEDATLVASEFGFEVEKVGFEEEDILVTTQDKPQDLKPRPPVVTVMGHVDHGKTSLLDYIRHANVVSSEAGGITQHIGAYNVGVNGGRVVFLDTPGHEAFTQMRSRGAQTTDVVVLVVAADDGVMQQTKEAINHAKAAEVPIVVAVNKIDKPGADPQMVRRELSDFGLTPEDWGGDTIFVDVSAKTGQGVEDLLEMLQLQSEVLELAANPDKPARGIILEARLDKGRGAVATVLVQEGTLHTGEFFVCGVNAGKVRAMFDDQGRRVDEAPPSIPVEVQGFGGVPLAGDDFAVVENEKAAKQIASHRALKKREAELSAQSRLSLEGFFDQMKEGESRELKLVVKADVQGSVEALTEALAKLGNEEVGVNVIHSATGAITESDVMLASASEAIIVGFNVRPAGKVSELAASEQVDIRTYEVIYQIIEDVTAALTGMLKPIISEEVIGRAEVIEVFKSSKVGTIAGSAVREGKVERGARVRLLRDGVVVATTSISSLRRFKDDVKEVLAGFECGIGLENYNDIKLGDELEAFIIKEEAAQL